MAAESLTPSPPTGGGSAKFIIVALLLLAGGLGVYLAMGDEPEEPPPPPEVKKAEPTTALSDTTFEIPVEEDDEEEDAAVEPEEPPEPKPTRTRPVADAWACRGDLQPSDIKRVLIQAQSSIRSCYERRLRNNNMLQGSINLQVRVNDAGKVADTRIRGTMRDQDVRRCVERLAKNWTFPPPSGGNCAVFDAPYNFTPKN